jgi:hypothetical protein
MLQLSEIKKIEAFSHADTIEQCRADLDAVEKQLGEMEAPVRELEAEIEQIKATLERGAKLKVSDPADFIKQGGDVLVTDLEVILSMKIPQLETLRIETQNLQQPLQITKSNLLALLAQKREKSLIRKEREEHLRVNAESPINLTRWVNRSRVKPTIWKVIAMAQKREDQILNEICNLYQLKIVSKNDLSDHYARKYNSYRFRLYRRGYYLIPDDQPKGRKINQTQNNDEITANEHQNEAAG